MSTTYIPENTYHNPASQLSDGETLNETNINKLARHAADNAEYALDQLFKTFREVINSIAGTLTVGLDFNIIGGSVGMATPGRIIFRHMYFDVNAEAAIGTYVNGYKIYATFTISGKTYIGSLNYGASVPADSATVLNVELAETTGGLIVWTVPHTALETFMQEVVSKMHAHNTDTYTTAVDFFVGGDSVTGRKVVLLSEACPAVLNFRIEKVSGGSLKNTAVNAKISQSIQTGSSNKLSVSLGWGFDDLVGIGDVGGAFQIKHPTLFVETTDYFKGYYFSYGSETYRIASSTVSTHIATDDNRTTVYLVDSDGVAADIAAWGDISGTGNKGIVHHNAERYEIVSFPRASGVRLIEEPIEKIVIWGSPVSQRANLVLDIGTEYNIYIRSIKGVVASNFVELPAGSFTQDSVLQTYTKPYLAKHPDISSVGAAVTLTSGRNGFSVEIAGWSNAELFEICYTDASKTPDFNNLSHFKYVFNTNAFDIQTLHSGSYVVAVRPLISGQQVALPKTGQVVAGSVGIPPNAIPIVSEYINLKTFTGTINVASTGNAFGTIASIVNALYSPSALPADLVGDVISIEGVASSGVFTDYIISAIDGAVIHFVPVTNGSLLISGVRNYKINMTKRGRQIVRLNALPIDYKLIRIDFDCDIHYGNPVHLRVFQLANELDYDALPAINASDFAVTADADLLISGTVGTRTLIVDLWDDDLSTPENGGSVSGHLTILAVPYSTNTLSDPHQTTNFSA